MFMNALRNSSSTSGPTSTWRINPNLPTDVLFYVGEDIKICHFGQFNSLRSYNSNQVQCKPSGHRGIGANHVWL